MCGILGVRRSWCRERPRVERALASLGWRGPDGATLEEVGDWYLGVARLAITDPDTPQPIHCPATGRVVVFNGAVTSATREWAEVGAARQTGNDAELALLRMRAGGPAALTATCGPYALAVLDPALDVVWLARDPEGEKPLFAVTEGHALVAFASSVAALRELGLDVGIDPANTGRLLRYGFGLGPSLVGSGQVLHSGLRGVHVARPGAGLEPMAGDSPAEAGSGAALVERVVAAVTRCATADVDVGLCLSGGVDSACMAVALARRRRSLPAYQFRAVGVPDEERTRARAVAAATGMELREVDGDHQILDALVDLTRATGMPQGDPSVLAAHALARAARADGVGVLLSGEGADDQWLGYRRHRAAAWLPRQGWRMRPAVSRLSGALSSAWLPWRGLSLGSVARLARAVTAPTPYDALLEVSPPAFLDAVIEPGALPMGGLPDAEDGQSALSRARFADRQFYLRHDLLPKCDTAMMAAGVEGRCPYLDPEVLSSHETLAADPRAILGKRSLKAAFAAELPAGILERRKLGFGLPLDRWLRTDCLLTSVLTDPATAQRPHIRSAGLQRMLGLHRAGRAHLGHALYLVVALELYLRWLEGQL